MSVKTYWLTTGTVQPMARSDSPWWCYHFGHAQYDRDKPILTDSIRAQAQPIIDALNAGTMTREEAEKELDKIWL